MEGTTLCKHITPGGQYPTETECSVSSGHSDSEGPQHGVICGSENHLLTQKKYKIRHKNINYIATLIVQSLIKVEMTARNKNRWIVNLKLAVRELQIASTKLSRRASVERNSCKENMRKGNMKEAKIHAEKSVQEINLMENYKQSSQRLKALIVLLNGRSSQDHEFQIQIEGIVRLIDVAMRHRHLKNIKSILDKYGTFFFASSEETESKISKGNDSGDVKTLLEEIAKEENIGLDKVFVKEVKSCLSQKSSKLSNISGKAFDHEKLSMKSGRNLSK